MMSDSEFAELELRATICPGQCGGRNPSTCIGNSLDRLVDVARQTRTCGRTRAPSFSASKRTCRPSRACLLGGRLDASQTGLYFRW